MNWTKWLGYEKGTDPKTGQPSKSVADLLDWQTRHEACSRWQIAEQNLSLLELERHLDDQPATQLVCVCDERGGLAGLLNVHNFYHRLLYRVAPPEILSELVDHHSLREYFDCVCDLNCGEIMSEPIAVKTDDPLKKIYETMRLHNLEIVPVTNDDNQVVACLQLADLVGFWTNQYSHNLVCN